ncbi:hypothetical protein [Aquabacterium sp. OR-4]|uniref:hypothetical protein n=1 Tax=Aquabacterium sp. OR-4 TaxID=2978127 RepID=UPI0028C64EB3|nr:hypothetical protein [Aquabacterium sp. OR-4]MDT7838106.1 hypothetical protein [Aquabacterium sp. OR-4]
MNPSNERPDAAEADLDDELPLPCPHALIAGTLALMTTWADPAPGTALDVASLRSLLARKVVSNLFFLAEHPALSDAMRQVMAQARERWQGLARGEPCAQAGCLANVASVTGAANTPTPPSRWH